MINIKQLIRATTKLQIRKDEYGELPYKEFEERIENDIREAIWSIEIMVARKGKHSISTNDIIEYFSFVGRPKLWEDD